MVMAMLVLMFVLVNVSAVSSALGMLVLVVAMFMIVIAGQVNIKFHAADTALVTARKMQVIAIQVELGQFAFQLSGIDAQIHQRTNKHIAADAAKQIQIQGLHSWGGRGFTRLRPGH